MRKVWFAILMLWVMVAGICFGKDYKGAEYRTKEAFLYGRFEARYKPPQAGGIVSSFFTYHEITTSREWNEIDFEILGRYDHDVLVTSIGPGQKIHNSHQYVAFNTHENFHDYAFEWTPTYIAWFIDGMEVYRQTQAHIAEFDYAQKIMMNLWISDWEPWVGNFDDRVLPLFAYYDWISYAAYTPGSGDCGTDNNFTLQWKDELNGWDQDRWEKATHTFGGNLVDFMPENIVFKDGIMILCLTKSTPLGYVDQSPPAVLWNRVLDNAVEIGFSEDVEPISAQKMSNYIITSATVSEAKLLPDQRTVELAVSELNPQNSNNLIVLGVKDNSAAHNMMFGQNMPLNYAMPLKFPLKINVGGQAYRDYLADQLWSPELEYGHQDGYINTWPSSIDIIGADDDTVYWSELQEIVEYKVRAPNGVYRITLLLAENKFIEPGLRIFDIQVEGHQIASELDLVQFVGAHAAYQIMVDEVEIDDGRIDIHFTNRWNFSLLNGIIVEQISVSQIDKKAEVLPSHFQLYQNYPNPFNASTAIGYFLPASGYVNLNIYNLQGQKMAELVNKAEPGGYHQIHWTPELPSGIYFYQINFLAGAQSSANSQRMILLR